MRIKELSDRTSVSTRLLRYYEEQGLLCPARLDNGYRDYGEVQVVRVRQIRGLLDAGLPVGIIRDVLPCLTDATRLHADDPDPEFVRRIEHERDRVDERIAVLCTRRRGLDGYLGLLTGGRAPADPVAGLTGREREVLELVAQGSSNQEIADALAISERTARTHVSHVLRKLGLESRVQAAVCAIRAGIVAAT